MKLTATLFTTFMVLLTTIVLPTMAAPAPIGLTPAETRVLDIQRQIEAASPQTEVGKALLATLEVLLEDAERAVEAERG